MESNEGTQHSNFILKACLIVSMTSIADNPDCNRGFKYEKLKVATDRYSYCIYS